MQDPTFLIMMIAIIAVYYFLLIRPQQQRAKAHRELINNLKKGDEVISQGGIYGKVVSTDEGTANIEIAKGVNIKVIKSSIQAVTEKK